MSSQLKEWLILFGGFLGTLKLFLASVGIHFYTQEQADSLIALLESMIPLVLVGFAIYKNTYIITDKAKKQDEVLKKEGLK